MNAQVQPLSPAKALPFGQVALRGRVEVSKVVNDFRYTRLALPAPDQYAKPALVEVRSKKGSGPIGGQGEEVTVTCQVGGFPRSWTAVDRDTGELGGRKSAVQNTLDLVE